MLYKLGWLVLLPLNFENPAGVPNAHDTNHNYCLYSMHVSQISWLSFILDINVNLEVSLERSLINHYVFGSLDSCDLLAGSFMTLLRWHV